MLTGAALRIVERAIELRIQRGEEIETTVRYYTKLSEEQIQELITKYTAQEAEKIGTDKADEK